MLGKAIDLAGNGRGRSSAFRMVLCLCACIITLSASALAQFETRGSFTTQADSHAESAATGDFNNDGFPDLALVSYCCPGGGVSILLGNGDGTFRPAANYAAGNQPWFVAAADLNHDGNLDLIVANSLGTRLTILLGNGDGTLRYGAQSPEFPSFQSFVAVGDFNGDGKPDIAALSVSNPCKCISIAFGKGNGAFEKPVITRPPFDVESMGIGDFNGDGKLDLATAGDFTVNILLGNGDGTFEYGASYPSPETPESMTVADFNGDHKLDFATGNSEGSSISVLLGNGDGTFQGPATYPVAFPGWVTTADVNGDGKPDLVAASDYGFPSVSGLAVFLGKGDGTFASPDYYATGGNDASFVATADFNGDGKVDAAIIDIEANAAIVMLNTGVASFSPSSLLFFKNQAVGTTSTAQEVTFTNTGKKDLNISSMKVAGQFAMTSTCSKAIIPNKSCTISVTFSPKSKGAKSGTVTIIDSASSKPQVIELSGTGM